MALRDGDVVSEHLVAGKPAPGRSWPLGFHQHADPCGCPCAPRVGLELERQFRAITARRTGGLGRGVYREGYCRPIARPPRQAPCSRARPAGERLGPESRIPLGDRLRAQSALRGCKDARFVRCPQLRGPLASLPRSLGKIRVRTPRCGARGEIDISPDLRTPQRGVPTMKVESAAVLAENARSPQWP